MRECSMRGVQKVCSKTHLTTRYPRHILSFFNIVSCNRNALIPALLQSLDAIVEELFILTLQPVICSTDNVLIISKFASVHEFLELSKQVVVTWCQIWRMWWVLKQFKARILYGSQCLTRRMSRCIVLVKQNPATQLSLSPSVLFELF